VFRQPAETNGSVAPQADNSVRRFVVQLATGLVTAAVSAVVGSQIKGPWTSWSRFLAVGVLAAIAVYFLVWAALTGLAWLRTRRRAQKLEERTRGPLLACVAIFTEAMSQSFVKSVGSVLNRLHDCKALDPRAANAYQTHLGTLATSVRFLSADVRSKRVPASEGLQRLIELHRDYVRLCCEAATAISATSPPDLHRSWDEIRDYTNLISNRLTDLSAQAREGDDQPLSPPYFQSVPRVYVAS
jgi:hypothetical protein